MPQTTFPPGLIYQQAEQFVNELDNANQLAVDRMLAAWAQVYANVRGDYDQLLAKIKAARDAGQDVSPAWLYQQRRLKAALATTKVEVSRYAADASTQANKAHDAAVRAALANARKQVTSATAEQGIDATFTALDEAPVRAMVGFLADGSPLAALFDSFGQDAADAARQVLLKGVGQGKGIDWMARRLDKALDVPRWRAETIVRTESHRIYRETSRRTYQANAAVLEGWVWTAHLDTRTCPACVVMDGTLHGLDETLDGHPRCRCAMVPRTKSWADLLGIDAADEREPVRQGKAWLEAQPDAVQRSVLGPAKYRAWKAGDMTLDDVVARTHSHEWGSMRRERTMREIREGRNANDQQPAPIAVPDVAPAPEPAPERPLTPGEQRLADVLTSLREAQRRDLARLEQEVDPDQRRVLQRAIDLNARTAATVEQQLTKMRAATDEAQRGATGVEALPRKAELIAGMVMDQQTAIRDDVMATNPGYDTPDRNYRVNCVHVANTYELRRRGYAVTASPLPASYKGRGRSAREALNGWRQPDGDVRELERLTPRQVEKEALTWPVGARGWVVVVWKGRGAGGHIFNVERVAEGVKYVEAQSHNPDLDIQRYWRNARPGSVLLCRVDDLIPTDDVLQFVQEG